MFGLVHRHLDPSESLLEILFGLIMALTMTAGARLLALPHEVDRLELAIGLLGCNVAWGVIDAVFYVLGSVFNRNRRVRFTRRLQAASDAEALTLIREEFDLEDEPPAPEAAQAAMHASLLSFFRHASPRPARITRKELAAAAIVLVLVVLTAVPGLVPLLTLPSVELGLRAANALQVLLLLAIGYRWARYTGSPGWRGALIVGGLGVGLVLVAVALGG